ncbi:NYN domain-containing protein [Zymobacter palmae]|uniref:NYN domain-containing protein n=1 Tax=Zymobacter palmae TaxID=33074 RepID=UPI0006874BBB|nr:NYN domain-containing protein [Zymobacter palmae]
MSFGRSFSIFLDGGFLKHKIGTKEASLSKTHIEDLIKKISAHEYLQDKFLHRAFFYDAKPLERVCRAPDGKEIDFSQSKLAKTNKALHSSLQDVPFLSLRFGELSMQGWSHQVPEPRSNGQRETHFPLTLASKDFKANISQKGVDMRIGLDMASVTLKEHSKIIALVTGDSDFIPAMKFARREGAQVILFTLGHSLNSGVAEHADLVVHSIFNDLSKPEATS